jgi:hypothetical protein
VASQPGGKKLRQTKAWPNNPALDRPDNDNLLLTANPLKPRAGFGRELLP